MSELELDLASVKARAVKGVVALTGRTFILQIITIIAQGFLWAFLTPEQFGVFWIVSAIVNFLVYFSDIGLAAALIQKREKPTEEDLKTTFTVQQGLVIVLLIILFFIGDFASKSGSLSPAGKMLLYALGFSFFLSSLKSIPSVLLERGLEFSKLIIPQVLETLVYNVVIVYLAWRGFGISSFSYAVIIRGLVGLTSMYLVKPWMPGLRLSKKSFKDLLKFGLPYQTNSLLAVVKDNGITILLGGILGAGGVGILGTAQRLTAYPLIFMGSITQVSFPAFSRMQDDKKQLSTFLNRSLFFITFLAYPALLGLIVLAPYVMKVVPQYQKWTPALIPLYFLSINTFLAAISTQLTNFFNAIGKIKITFQLMVMWTVLTLVLVPVLAYIFGANGAGLAYGVVGLSSILVIYIASRLIELDLISAVVKPAGASVVMGIIVWGGSKILYPTVPSLILLVILGAISYLVIIYLLIGTRLKSDIKRGLNMTFGIRFK